jgi:hypothetical protein
MKGTSAVLAAAGLGILLQSPAWAASGPQPASGTFLITSSTVDSARVADGNTILVIALTGNATGTFDGRFTETDHEMIHPTAASRSWERERSWARWGHAALGPSGTWPSSREPSLLSTAGS